jgi:exodeoxyribonuclease VII large subunit
LISSHFVEALERVDRATEALDNVVSRARQTARERLSHAGSRLRLLTPAAQVERGYLRLDDLSNRLAAALGAAAQHRRRELHDARARFLRAAPDRRIELASHRLLSLWKRLQASSPASVLHRGFVIMRDGSGQPVIRAQGIAPGQPLSAEFADGKIEVKVENRA